MTAIASQHGSKPPAPQATSEKVMDLNLRMQALKANLAEVLNILNATICADRDGGRIPAVDPCDAGRQTAIREFTGLRNLARELDGRAFHPVDSLSVLRDGGPSWMYNSDDLLRPYELVDRRYGDVRWL